MLIFRHNLGPLDNNTYVVVDEASGHAAIVDPSFDSRFILQEILSAGWTLRFVLNTHAHIDHVVENAFFVRTGAAPLALHPLDLPLLSALEQQAAWLGMEVPDFVAPDISLTHCGEIAIGDSRLSVRHTPGHSPGHVCFIGDDFALVGDVLFQGSIGRTDLPGGSHDELLSSIRGELMPLPDETVVYPGHGSTTTIGHERRSNPFLVGL
jgi:hydroxyacylglutathione hydrolase